MLGLSDNPSEDDIKKAYRKMAFKYHPDKNPGDTAAEEQFKKLTLAKEVLTQPEKFDQFSSSGGMSGRSFDEDFIRDFMAGFFRSQNRPQQKQRFKQAKPGSSPVGFSSVDLGDLAVSLNQALFRENISIRVKAKKACEECLGTPGTWYECKGCSGYGVITTTQKRGQVNFTSTDRCFQCKGRGWRRNGRCIKCKGNLVYFKEKSVDFKLPSNYKVGQRIRIPKQGNESWKAKNGDIYVTPRIIVPDLSGLSQEDKATLLSLLKKVDG